MYDTAELDGPYPCLDGDTRESRVARIPSSLYLPASCQIRRMSRIRDQIAAKRAEARGSPAASSGRGAAANAASRVSTTPGQRSRFGDEELLEARSVDAQIKHAARSGEQRAHIQLCFVSLTDGR